MTTARPEARGEEVPFTKIAEAIGRRVCQDNDVTPMRALVATIVAVGPTDRLDVAADTLQTLADAGTVRAIMISEGNNPAPAARVAGNTVALHGLKHAYIDNAVAALRLSSLPTLVWWRGGTPDTLGDLAELADRVVLDEDDPEPIWRSAAQHFEASAFSDVRWARLTQWRRLMAHFFDIPEVHAAALDFTTLRINAHDRLSALLFAAWFVSSMQMTRAFTVDISGSSIDAPIEEIRLGDGGQELLMRLAESTTCLETAVSVRGHRSASRVVSLGDQSLTGVLTEEVKIRARDAAFERALKVIIEDGIPLAHPRGAK